MFGAILGDIIGSPYEFGRNDRVKDFPLFTEQSVFTDDSVMTLAIARVLLVSGNMDEEKLKEEFISSMQELGHAYPDVSYGGQFACWLESKDPKPYNSFGNGSAMRVSAVGWLFDSLEAVRHMARLSAEVTHNHPEGIKGAEAVASAIYLARTGSSKEAIKAYVEENFDYDLERSCDEIRPNYKFDETCQGTVPEAFAAFFEGESFEDVIRTAISLGGDSDTLAAIAGSVAEAYYGINEDWKKAALCRLPEPLADILREFDLRVDRSMNSTLHPVHEAIIFAARAHAGQKRKGTDIDYITHPLEVLNILTEMGAGRELQTAGVLHDTVEDTDTTIDEIRRIFGERVATLVGNHSAPHGMAWEETRRRVLDELAKADRDTKLLVMADKLANLRSMAADYAVIGEKLWERFHAPKEKQGWYVNEMLGILRDFEQDSAVRNTYCEMTNLFKDLFVDYYVDEEKNTIYQLACFGEGYRLIAQTGLWMPYHGHPSTSAMKVSRQRGERYEELWRYRYSNGE